MKTKEHSAEHQGVKAHKKHSHFDEHHVLHELKHYLPAQAPLKDFIHHNTLHAFQKLKFHEALRQAPEIFGYKVQLSLDEYRKLYDSKRIRKDNLEKVIEDLKGKEHVNEWMEKVLRKDYDTSVSPRVGALRAHWKNEYKIDMDGLVHPILFRVLCSYLDQGIAIWHFPVWKKGFLSSLKEIERNNFTSFFKTKRVRDIFLNTHCEIDSLLKILVGDESLYEQYLFDQQFSHQGWSGIVSNIEDLPQGLLDKKRISLHELIIFEILLEIDTLENKLGKKWFPLSQTLKNKPEEIFAPVTKTELSEVLEILQEAFEWTYYDQVLNGIRQEKQEPVSDKKKSFQAMFCIDDRECSFRRYLEKFDPECETFGTPGFFSVEFFFKPEGGKFYTKLCPAPVTPKYLVKEVGTKTRKEKELVFTKPTHSLFRGWIITQTLGFWSAFRLLLNVFKPSMSPAAASSFKHMDKVSKLEIENTNPDHKENDLQVGFTIDEMATRVENLLKSIGLIKDFAPVIYVVGHGSSSINNPHFSAYDCGACSGRPGSVNARVICFMANHPKVREVLKQRGITIPAETQFLGGLHDTTRDDIAFYDEELLSPKNAEQHHKNELIFDKALDYNSKERSRRLVSIDTKLSAKEIHEKVRKRSVSLFEPRPELNHATNTLCIVGKRELTKGLFLDRRAFMNSYDYKIDPEGNLLLGIVRPLGPVCGGINLEYYFSRVDNQKLGAGTKLPHNVMGLFGVANGADGDLRPGLPSQMIEVHDPVRLLIIIEHFPDVVLNVIQRQADTYEWFINEWVHLIAVNPETHEFFLFKNGAFTPYEPVAQKIETVSDVTSLIEDTKHLESTAVTDTTKENLPVYLIK